MSWEIVARKIGRAGNPKQQAMQQNIWDEKYGEGNWAIGYFWEDEFLTSEEAFQKIYFPSYAKHFEKYPQDLSFLVQNAKKLRNPHAEATKGVDLQVPAIMQYLKNQNLQLEGTEIIDIGTWKNNHSHPISVKLSPLHIKFMDNEKMALEQYWQEKKVLVVWEND